MNMTDDGSVSDGDGRLNYRAMTDFETKMFNINYRSRNRTDEELSAHKPGDGSDIRNITCATQHTTYTAHVSYLNESQNVALKRIAEKPFDELAFRRSAKFWDMLGAKPSETGFEYSKEGIHNRTMDELWQIYRDAQIAAMRETLTRPMTGYVAALWGFYSAAEGVQSYNHSATLVIQQTPLVEYVRDELGYQYREIYFRLSPSIVDRLMQNVTISLLNTASSNTSTMVTTTVYRARTTYRRLLRHPRYLPCFRGAGSEGADAKRHSGVDRRISPDLVHYYVQRKSHESNRTGSKYERYYQSTKGTTRPTGPFWISKQK
jgi:hypothetical protein